MKYIKKLNIDFDNWNKLNDSGWHNMKFVKGKTIDYYKKMYPEWTKVRIRKDSIYYDNSYYDKLSNPIDTIGYLHYYNNLNIIDIYYHIFYVNWSNGQSNSYKITDLEYYKI
jgi:hypothetical protein